MPDKNLKYDSSIQNKVIEQTEGFYIVSENTTGPFESRAEALHGICSYCGGLCPVDGEISCEGFLDDVDNLHGDRI